MLAKGHHFDNITLVGIIDADMGLAGGDLRAGERTFQLLHQVMGRAGRAQKKGEGYIQSYQPDNLIIQALRENNRGRFIEEEIASRQLLKMPPFGRLASLIITGPNQVVTHQVAQKIVKMAPSHKDIDILGPTPAPIHFLRGKYRFRVLVKTSADIKVQNMLGAWLKNAVIPNGVDVRVDINPYSFF
jgi:primosomal protein N' (replication factor Y)